MRRELAEMLQLVKLGEPTLGEFQQCIELFKRYVGCACPINTHARLKLLHRFGTGFAQTGAVFLSDVGEIPEYIADFLSNSVVISGLQVTVFLLNQCQETTHLTEQAKAQLIASIFAVQLICL